MLQHRTLRRRGAARSREGSALIIATVVSVVMIGVAGSFLAVSSARHTIVENGFKEMNARMAAEAAVDSMIVKLNADGALGIIPVAGTPTNMAGTLTPPNIEITYGETAALGSILIDGATDGVDNNANGSIDEAGEAGNYTGSGWSGQAEALTVGLGAKITARGNYGNFNTQLVVQCSAINTPISAKFGLFGDISTRGVGTSVSDSYRSSLGSYASQATNIDPISGRTYARSEGNIGSNGPINLNGTVAIFGNSTAGPGSTTTTTGRVTVQGSTAPATTPVPLDPVVYAPDPPVSSGDIRMAGSQTQNLTAGSYHISSLTMTANSTLNITGDVTLYVDGATNTAGQSVINVTATGKLTLITNGDISVAGGGVVNASQIPANLIVKSTTAGTVSMGGNSTLFTSIYAPAAAVDIRGTSALFGAAVGRTIFFNGTIDFHYDEDLGGLNAGSVYVFTPQSWSINSQQTTD